jgi:diguanylate cyclase (GGDEF)-like protein
VPNRLLYRRGCGRSRSSHTELLPPESRAVAPTPDSSGHRASSRLAQMAQITMTDVTFGADDEPNALNCEDRPTDREPVNSTTEVRSGEALLAARTSVSHVIGHLFRAVAGLTVAFVVARAIVIWIGGDEAVGRSDMLLEIPIQLVAAGIALTFTSAIPISNDLRRVTKMVTRNERELERRSSSQVFLRDVQHAFEMANDEGELFDVAGLALGEIARDEVGGTEILVADSSGAHVSRSVVSTVGSAPGCGVDTPGACPAVRRGQTLGFEDPSGLAACPRLRERELPAGTGATCVPVTVLGTPSAVLHATYSFIEEETEYDKLVDSLEGVAVQLGARLGMLRAMSRSQLQAETDPLTGLLNRRAMENQVRDLRSGGKDFAVAMLDLDHFKLLNDTYGHDTGDRALRLFTRVLTDATRELDIVCRHGGEEFVVVLPDATVTSAAPVFQRLRTRLAEAVASSQVPPFTVSIGLCDSTWSEDLQELLNSADNALMEAKDQGRDRLIIDEPSAGSTTPMPATGELELNVPDDLGDVLSNDIFSATTPTSFDS